MARRKTPLAGLPKPRLADRSTQRVIDAVVERIEILDGIRGDSLDKAVTFRDLDDSGFTLRNTGGGTTQIVNTPGPGGGGAVPGTGPAAAPRNLMVNETFLALLLAWDNASFNLQHNEIWRSATDNLSTAIKIATSITPIYVDYVGALASYYYWVRSVGNDGSFSAYNDTAGTLGTTGVDPSDFEVEMNISADNLDAALSARINLIDDPTTGLVDRVTLTEGDILGLDSRTDTLETNVSGIEVTVDGQTTLINAHTSSIETNETGIALLDSALTDIISDVSANSDAIVLNATSILILEASFGALDAEGGETWDFVAGSLEGWTVVNGTLTNPGSALDFTPTSTDARILNNTISINGGLFTQVVARIRQTLGGGTWEGNCFYATSGHASGTSFKKTIADPSLELGEWNTLTWDMANLTTGGTDWQDSTIIELRLDLVSDAAARFEIDWVIIAKVSSTALSEAISALDARVTISEGEISSQATSIIALTSQIEDPSTGLEASSTAILGLTTDVATNLGQIEASAALISALTSVVDDPVSGVEASAYAISILETSAGSNTDGIAAQALQITQLLATTSGGVASLVNPLTTVGAGFGTDYLDTQIQVYNALGGRDGVAARVTASTFQKNDFVRKANDTRLYVDPNTVYEISFSVYHDRPVEKGTFRFGLHAYATETDSSQQTILPINNGVAGSATVGETFWFSSRGAVASNEWVDVTCYLLGANVDATKCPEISINGDIPEAITVSYLDLISGWKIINNPFVEFRFCNRSDAPNNGDNSATTLYVTNVQVQRADAAAGNYALLEVAASAIADDVGDLHALYTVKVELTTGNPPVPYITGFGLAADIIAGAGTSAFGIQADQFYITSPSFGESPGDTPGSNQHSKFPFVVDLIDNVATVAIDGSLIVDGSITASSIFAKTIGGDKLDIPLVITAIAEVGILTGGLIKTADSPAFRVELEEEHLYPLWYGSGDKEATTARFYVDKDGNVVVRGLLDAAVIKQALFTPANATSSFKIATQYNDVQYLLDGEYIGKKAQLFPHILTRNASQIDFPYSKNYGQIAAGIAYPGDTWNRSETITLLGPTNTTTKEYGRLGTTTELLMVEIGISIDPSAPFGNAPLFCALEYRYDGAGSFLPAFWFECFGATEPEANKFIKIKQGFVTRGTTFSTLELSVLLFVDRTLVTFYDSRQYDIDDVEFSVYTSNFGIADSAVKATADNIRLDLLQNNPKWG